MFTSVFSLSGDIGGAALGSTITRSAAGQIGQNPTLNGAKAGNLSTRTSNTAGIATLSASHGIVATDVVDIYWTGGRRYGATVSAVATNDCTFSGGSGDNLPAATTTLTMAKQQTIDTDFVGDLVVAIGALCGQRGHLSFLNGSTVVLSVDLAANETWSWFNGGTAANPLATLTVTSVAATQESVNASPLKLGVLYNS